MIALPLWQTSHVTLSAVITGKRVSGIIGFLKSHAFLYGPSLYQMSGWCVQLERNTTSSPNRKTAVKALRQTKTCLVLSIAGMLSEYMNLGWEEIKTTTGSPHLSQPVGDPQDNSVCFPSLSFMQLIRNSWVWVSTSTYLWAVITKLRSGQEWPGLSQSFLIVFLFLIILLTYKAWCSSPSCFASAQVCTFS